MCSDIRIMVGSSGVKGNFEIGGIFVQAGEGVCRFRGLDGFADKPVERGIYFLQIKR